LKDCGIVFLLRFDHVVHDPGEFVSGSGHGLWGAHPRFHAPEIVAKEGIASV